MSDLPGVVAGEAQVGEAVALPSPKARLSLNPLDPDDDRRLGLRGVTIHWQEAALVVPSKRRRKGTAPTPSAPVNRYARFPFSALRKDQDDRPPKGPEEYRRYALMAYALAALANPIPSDADVRYEVSYAAD